MDDDKRAYYWLGKRDGYAEVLAETYKKVRLPKIAKDYEKLAGEKHFSHQYHTASPEHSSKEDV